MTDARLGGIAREALVADSGLLRAGGIVREALVAGIGLSATVTGESSVAAVVFALQTNLSAQIGAASAGRPSFNVHINLGGQGRAESSISAGPLSLHFNLTAQSKASSSARSVLSLHVSLGAQAAARSSARAVATLTTGVPSASVVTAASQAAGALLLRLTLRVQVRGTSSAGAVLSGIRVSIASQMTARSSLGAAAIVMPGGVLLRASASTTVSEAAGHLSLHINLASRIAGASSARSSLPTTMLLHGAITTQSKMQFMPLSLRVLGARVTAKSDSGMSAIVAAIHTREGALTMNVS
jgi:hypothetical protein